MSHQVTFEFPWLSEPFVPENNNVYDLIDSKIEKLKCVFPHAHVISKQVLPREWRDLEKAYLNRVRVLVELGEPDTDYLTKE